MEWQLLAYSQDFIDSQLFIEDSQLFIEWQLNMSWQLCIHLAHFIA
jgi:hypothetical protein